ncbi:PAS domain-containing sensor histidine kinase [Litoribacillus peritrichatus]|uniref:histidine kinase n=1 Tax=Litoribacillus peritrichatus TaxID=718191 RepID=A0ABP7MKH4_9GAMM
MKLPNPFQPLFPKQGIAFSKLIALCLITALGITAATTLSLYYLNALEIAKQSTYEHNQQQAEITNLRFEELLSQTKNAVIAFNNKGSFQTAIQDNPAQKSKAQDIQALMNQSLRSNAADTLDLMVFMKSKYSTPIIGGASPYPTQSLFAPLPHSLPSAGFHFLHAPSPDGSMGAVSAISYGIEIVSGKLNRRQGYLFGIVILNDNVSLLNRIMKSTRSDAVTLFSSTASAPNQNSSNTQVEWPQHPPIAWVNAVSSTAKYTPNNESNHDHFNQFELTPLSLNSGLTMVLWQQQSWLETHQFLFWETLAYVTLIVLILILSIISFVTMVSSKSLQYLNQFAQAKTQHTPRIRFEATLISEINQVGNRLEKAIHDLAVNEEMYRNILNNSGAVVYLKDLEGRYHFVNTEFECVTGISLQKALSKRDDELFDKAQAEHFMNHDQQVAKAQRMLTFREEVQQNNENISFISVKFPIKDAQGNIRYICGFSTDITGIIQTQEELKREKERAEQATQTINALNKNLADTIAKKTLELEATQKTLIQSEKLASLGALVAGISHELNTPIGTALTVASTLETKTAALADQFKTNKLTKQTMAEYIDDLTTSEQILTRALSSAINIISSFKQISVDQTSEHRRTFNLAQTIREIATTHSFLCDDKNIQLIDLVTINGELDSYPGAFTQVLNNLINNAATHAFDEHEHGTISISASCEHEKAYIVVSDNGKGIPRENQNKVFDPFFTTRLGQGGSGLGLHIVHTIVTGILGGSIELHSRQGGINSGTDIRITVPLTAPKAEHRQDLATESKQ